MGGREKKEKETFFREFNLGSHGKQHGGCEASG